MTTPRVTVPLTDRMISAADGYIRSVALNGQYNLPPMFRWHDMWSAMISAAPAPEGGADHISTSGEMVGPQSFPLHGENDLLNHSLKAVRVLRTMMAARSLDAGVKVSDGLIADLEVALATREEAPACEMCNGRGEVGGPTGQTPESFDYVTERCPDCGGTGKFEAPAEAGEDAAWTWLNGHVDGAPADRDYSADEMVDAFMAGAGQRARLVKALESIADEHQYRSGYCQTDIAVEPALTAAEAQTVARAALRAQPQAREDAQPLGCFCDEADCLSCSSINPAPDALRTVTPELAAEFANIDGPWTRGQMEMEEVWSRLIDAQLAALQAEQGAK